MPPLATRSPMHRKSLPLPIAALLLGAALALRAVAAVPDWSVEITPDGELFPVLDLSQMPPKSAPAPGGGNGLVMVRVNGDGVRRHLRLEISTPGLREPAIVEAELERGATLELRPRLDWDIPYLRALKAPSHQVLHITLERSGVATQARDIDVLVHPLDDALYYVREGNDRIDLGWVFAAYVNPEDPVVEEIVANAREFDADFDQPTDSAEATLRKAHAVWAALTRHGLRYAAGDPALSRGPVLYSQRVRLLADVWKERRANCLDGSVLIASVLERIGIPAFIVLVPGHAFVGYRFEREQMELLETTVLGARTDAQDRRSPVAADDAVIAANFEAARSAGRARWRRVSTRFDRRHAPDYALIDIGIARSYGIIPLGAHGEDGGENRTSPTAGASPAADAAPAAGSSRKSSSQ
jgi:hypothetical protein